jgi:DNA-binding transcriptional MerR regulator
MKTHRYSLKELSEATGVEPRTIRWYIAEGLMRGPETQGRNAYYVEHHRARVESIKKMKDYGLSHREIRKYCQMAGEEDIQILALYGDERLPDDAELPDEDTSFASASERTSSTGEESLGVLWEEPLAFGAYGRASAYRERARRLRQDMLGATGAASLQERLAGSPLSRLTGLLRKVLGGRSVQRKAHAESSHVIDITPDIGLILRGDYAPEELEVFEELADCLREWMAGGGRDSP